MKSIYLDCSTGIAGDMFLGAMIDCGLNKKELEKELAKLNVPEFSISAERTVKASLSGINFTVEADEGHIHRNLDDILKIISNSALSEEVKKASSSMFTKLAEAEAHVHGKSINEIHFHEVGAVDSIVDIVGVAIAVELMGIDKIYCSPLPPGKGTVKCAHGVLPVPAPATAILLAGKPLIASDLTGELITPTGALIVDYYVKEFCDSPPFSYDNIGYGHGTREYKDYPNSLRIFMGKSESKKIEKITVAEFNVDDTNPQDIGFLMDKLFKNNVLDVFFTSVYMKKNRPGTMITFLCRKNDFQNLRNIVLEETTTLGIRYCEKERYFLERTFREIDSPFGKVKIKISHIDGKIRNALPEHDDCVRIAEENNLPLWEVRKKISESIKEINLDE